MNAISKIIVNEMKTDIDDEVLHDDLGDQIDLLMDDDGEIVDSVMDEDDYYEEEQ